ncbi:hypothetical protein [Actinokineospora sp. NPDC004072]
MRKLGLIFAAIAALAVVAPTSAAADTAGTAALAHCPNGLMVAVYGANVYSGWNSYRVIGQVSAGDVVACVEGYDLGRRYTACGITNGNGWVRLVATDGTRGWSPQGCFRDL